MEKPPEVPATLNQTGPASHSSVLHTPASIVGPPPPIIERTTAQGSCRQDTPPPSPLHSQIGSWNPGQDRATPKGPVRSGVPISRAPQRRRSNSGGYYNIFPSLPQVEENPAPSRSRRRAREDDDDASSDATSVASSTQRRSGSTASGHRRRNRPSSWDRGPAHPHHGDLGLSAGRPPSVCHAETEGGSYRAQSPDLYCHSYSSGGGGLLAQALGAHQEQVIRPPLQSSNSNPQQPSAQASKAPGKP